MDCFSLSKPAPNVTFSNCLIIMYQYLMVQYDYAKYENCTERMHTKIVENLKIVKKWVFQYSIFLLQNPISM